MAFSTQKDFFKIGFFNDDSQSAVYRKRSDGALKTYNSCTDVRSWSLDSEKRARYLYDLIHAGIDKKDREICGDRRFTKDDLCQMTQTELIDLILQLYKEIDLKNETLGYTEVLLHDAVIKLQNIQAIVEENEDLRILLKTSEEKLNSVINENEEIKNNLKCSNNEKLIDLRNEVDIKKAAGLLTCDMELKYRCAEIEELNKQLGQLSVLKTELNKLKAQNIALNERCNFGGSVDPEDSNDPEFLKNLVNSLKKQVAYMEKLEIDYGQAKVKNDELQEIINNYEAEGDINNLKQRCRLLDDVINEREKMKRQLDKMKGFETKLESMKKQHNHCADLEKERNELLDRLQKELKMNGNSEKQNAQLAERMAEMEYQLMELERIRRERDSYKNRIDKFADMEAEYEFLMEKCQDYDKVLSQMELYKIRYLELVEKEKKMRLKIQFAAGLEKELYEVKSQLCRAECIIRDNEENILAYIENINDLSRQMECKNSQICACTQCLNDMNDLKQTVDSLQQKVINSIEDNVMDYSATVIKDGHVEDLVATTKHALKAVHEEFEARARLEQEMDELKHQLSVCYQKDSNVSDNADYENLLNEFNKLKAKLEDKENELKELKEAEKQDIPEKYIKPEKEEVIKEVIKEEIKEEVNKVDEAELRKAEQQNDELKKILAKAKDELEALKNENDELKAKEKDYISRIASYKDKISDLEDELKKLKNLLEEERNRNAELLDQMKLFKNLQEENELLKNTLQEKDDLIADLTNQINKLKNEIIGKNDELKKMEDRLNNLENELNEQRELLEKAKDEIESFRNEIKHLGDQLLNERNTTKNANDTCTKAINDKENQIKSLENKNKELEDEINKLKQQLCDMEKLLAQKTVECDDLKDKLQTCSSEIALLKDNLSDLNNQLQDAKTTNDLLKNNLNNLQSEISSLKQSLADKDGEIKNLKDEKNSLNSKINELGEYISTLNKSMEDASKNNKDIEDDLRNQLKALLAENQMLKNDIKGLKDQIDKLSQLVSDIENEREKNKKLLAAIDDMQNQINTMHKPVRTESAILQVKNLTDAIDKLTAQLDSEMARNNELEELIRKLQKELDELRPLRDCKDKLAAAEAKIKLLENTGGAQIASVEHLSKQSGDFSKRNLQLENELDELRKQLKACQVEPKKTKSSHSQTFDLVVRSSVQTQHNSENMELASLKASFDNKLSSIQQLHMDSIKSLQLIHESQMESLQNEHDMEMGFFKMSLENLSLIKSTHDKGSQVEIVKKEVVKKEPPKKVEVKKEEEKKDDVCVTFKKGTTSSDDECGKDTNRCTCGYIPKITKKSQSKLNCICKKILETGFETLNMDQLSYLHEQVYLAGLRLNPEMEGKCGCQGGVGADGGGGGGGGVGGVVSGGGGAVSCDGGAGGGFFSSFFGGSGSNNDDTKKPKKNTPPNSKNQYEVRILKLEKELRKAHIILQNFKDMNRYEELHNKFFENMIDDDKNGNLGLSLMNEVSKKVLEDPTIPYQQEFDRNRISILRKKKKCQLKI